MPERSIEELLGQLPSGTRPDHEFQARLRARLAAELRATPDLAHGPDPLPSPSQFSNSEVIELQTLTKTPTEPPRSHRTWWRAAAVVLVAAGVVAAIVAVQRDDDSPVTNPTPQTTTAPTPTLAPTTAAPTTAPAAVVTTTPATVAPTTVPATVAPTTVPVATTTFVGATVEAFPIDTAFNPYFVAASDEVWVQSIAGELRRLDAETGEMLVRANGQQSSYIAVDANALWIADAITGDVIRLDPVDGTEVVRIPTGVEILENMRRSPSFEGIARSFAQIGGIVSTGDAVWVGDRGGAVMRIDPATNEIVETFEVPYRPDLLRVEGDRLLAADLPGGKAAVIDTDDGAVVYEFTPLDDLAGAGLYNGAAYFQDAATGTVTRVELATGEQLTSTALGGPLDPSSQPILPTGLAVSGAGVLVDTTTEPDSIHVLDPVTLEDVGTLAISPDHGDMTIASDGSVWVVRFRANEVVHITPKAL